MAAVGKGKRGFGVVVEGIARIKSILGENANNIGTRILRQAQYE